MATIKVKTGEEILVDAEDVAFLQQFDWKMSKNGYAYATVYMHRMLAKTPPGLHTDHRDRNKRNNQKINLRAVTPQENALNRGPCRVKRRMSGKPGKPTTSRFCGVSRAGNRWRASTYVGKIHRNLGSFRTEEEAHQAYQSVVKGI